MPLPERPSPFNEQISFRWFRAFGPRLPRVVQPRPVAALEPYEMVEIPRPGRRGLLGGTWFRAEGTARGAVLLTPPWLQWGRSYFHRRGRIQALREAGYHALTLDFPKFDGSGPVSGFFDRDVVDGLRYLAERVPGLPRHVWGVSAGGYWTHLALTWSDDRFDPDGTLGGGGAHGAMFEDVSPHLIEWSGRMMPAARPLHFLFRTLFPRSNRYLDLRLHAPELRARQVAYASGELDPGVPPDDTRELAELAGGRVLVVPEAGHLESIKLAAERVIALALETFEDSARASEGATARRPARARDSGRFRVD